MISKHNRSKKMIRTTSPKYPDEPYRWDLATTGQCTWYCYYRGIEEFGAAPCYWNREQRKGLYTNAKLWLENYKEPWEVKGPDYTPVHGDIAVFTGKYGHDVFIEEVNGDVALISEYNRIVREGFDTDNWTIGGPLKGCGKLIGYLHYPREEDISELEQLKQENKELKKALKQINKLSSEV